MKNLSVDWITEGHIDFEYKKYMLLGYLQSVGKQFDDKKIYPFLAELVTHYRNLISLRENKTIAENNFPQHLSRIDFENFRLAYERSIHDHEHLEIISEIIQFAIPRMAASIDVAKDIYNRVEEDIDIHSVGIVPMYTDSGYILFRKTQPSVTDVFEYTFTVIENAFTPFRGLKTTYIESYPHSLFTYAEAIKSDLLKKNRQFPNPATWVIETKLRYPFHETLFPVAKRCFIRYIEKLRA